jgi:integrase
VDIMKDKSDRRPPDSDPDDEGTAAKKAGRPRRGKVRNKAPYVAAMTRKLKQENAIGLRVLKHAIAEHPDDPFGQLGMFFESFRITAATGRKRQVSIKTEERYFDLLKLTLLTLRKPLNMHVRNLTELSTKHIRALTRYLEGRVSSSRLATLNSVQRRFGIWIGKPGLAPPLSTLVANPESARRSTSRTSPKTWVSMGIDPPAVFAAAAAVCRTTEMHMRLGWAFGLRVQEQLMFCPSEALVGDVLVITRGTKGGLTRTIKLHEPWQFDLVERARVMAEAHPRKLIAARRHLRLDQATSHYYYVCRKIGLTAAGRFHCTPHGARHSFAARGYEGITRVRPPVLGGAPVPAAVDRSARQAIAEQMGHGRAAVTAAYLGTTAGMKRAARKQLARLYERNALLGNDVQLRALAAAGKVTSFVLVGAAASGEPLQPRSPAMLFCEGLEPIPQETLEAIAARVGQLLRAKCVLVDRDALHLPTFEVLAIEWAGTAEPVSPLQCKLDFGDEST